MYIFEQICQVLHGCPELRQKQASGENRRSLNLNAHPKYSPILTCTLFAVKVTVEFI